MSKQTMFVQWIKNNPKLTILIIVIFSASVIGLIFLIIHIIESNKKASFNKSIIPLILSSSQECNDCQFIREYTIDKDINTYTCTPTKYQLDASENCKDDFCYPGHEQLYKNCFSEFYGNCNTCDYNSLSNNTFCYDESLAKVNGSDSNRNNFIRTLYIANGCKECLPSINQLNTNISNLRLKCILETNPYCTSCDFIEAMKTSCVDIPPPSSGKENEYITDTDKQFYIGSKCSCTPTLDQLQILKNIEQQGQNHIDCANEPYCDTTINLKDSCFSYLENILPQTRPPIEPDITLPPLPNDAIVCTNDCDFVNMFDKECFFKALQGSNGTASEYRFLIYDECQDLPNYCVPTETQSEKLDNMLADGILPWNCFSSPDNCDYFNINTCNV